jgi:uncharacterized membrane protein
VSARQYVVVAAAVGSGLAGGVFFAFSTFVMSGIRRLPASQGVTTMQAINERATTPAFMTLLFGTAALALGLGVDAVFHRDEDSWGWVVAGSVSYLAAIILTAAFHVPRNDALAALDPASAETVARWADYLREWVAGNHLRTAACTIAAVAFTLAT